MPVNTYSYEDLGEDLFQMLVQALLVREFPHLQCFPINMPDGGRDALSTEGKSRVVFQVKFARDPSKVDDPVGWISKAIEGEKEKIERLASRGLTEYILITNIQGTSHLDAGRIDKVSEILRQNVAAPSSCWWRDDLDRRLDSQFELKLRYPAVLRGTDIVQLLWSMCGQESDSRRTAAVNAYLAYHSKQESTVKFKQVDLVSKALFDLFIDVPVEVGKTQGQAPKETQRLERSISAIALRNRRAASRVGVDKDQVILRNGETYHIYQDEHGTWRPKPLLAGGASVLSDPSFLEQHPVVVLEGAPGQGKSTLTQYLAQIQRVRILDSRGSSTLRAITKNQHAPLAIPFRLELKDLAIWLKGLNPWSLEDGRDPRPHQKPRSLEGAIAGHVEQFSGGISFDVADLHAVMQAVPTLVLLDALDEVADINDRKTVVASVCESIDRLTGSPVRPQIIITSRPTAIAGSPSFPADNFTHLSLSALELPLAREYSNRWAAAKRLDSSERAHLETTLEQKLRLPHLAQLARNTMQLSILLSLVQRRGASLPDKRTELYNAYFEIFLDRESEKSETVRDNRDLLFDIHRFLGFHLHAEAEKNKTAGRLSHSRLEWLLRDYLTSERQPHTLVDSLLKGMVERFGALVSRVQGQYEFEVQPLQEYFAARYLNDTAPPSPTGRERPGTKAERFDGIASNPYWFNVTRFLAGCFNKGELADLADRLCDLVEGSDESGRPYARSLCVALLQDWVFSQSPKARGRVVRSVFNDLGLSWALTGYLDTSRGRLSSDHTVVTLPAGGGAEDLVELCWARLALGESAERTRGLCSLISMNSDPRVVTERWLGGFEGRNEDDLRAWMKVGKWISVYDRLMAPEILGVLQLTSRSCPTMAETAIVQTSPLIETLDGELICQLVRSLLDYGDSVHVRVGGQQSHVQNLIRSVSPGFIRAVQGSYPSQRDLAQNVAVELRKNAGRFPRPVARLAREIAQVWEESNWREVSTWIALVQAVERFGRRNLTSIELSVAAAAFCNLGRGGRGQLTLFDDTVTLVDRFRSARRMSESVSWWSEQAALAEGPADLALWCVAASAWMRGPVFLAHLSTYDSFLNRLEPELRRAVLRVTDRVTSYCVKAVKGEPDLSDNDVRRMHAVRADTLVILARKYTKVNAVDRMILERMDSARSATFALACLPSLMAEMSAEDALTIARKASGLGGERGFVLRFSGRKSVQREVSTKVLSNPICFPLGFVYASTQVALAASVSYRPVLSLAETDGWFVQEDE